MTSIVTSFVSPDLTRVAVVKIQGRDFTVRQSPKKVTTVWLGSARITKKAEPNVWYDAVQAAFTEWERPAEELRVTDVRTTDQAERIYREETVEDWGGPAPVVVTREYDAAPSAEVLPYRLAELGNGRWLVYDRDAEELWGEVRRAEESMRPGLVQWTRWVAYGPDGSRIGHTDSLPGAARLLVPLSEQAQETLAKTVCWHVTTYRGETYGVTAQTADEALTLTNARLRAEGENDWPNAANPVGMWEAEPGTVLHY